MKLIRSIVSTFIVAIVIIGSIFCAYRLFSLKYVHEIRQSADEMGVDRFLVAALIKAESNFNVDATPVPMQRALCS